MLAEDISREVGAAHRTNILWRVQSWEQRAVSPTPKLDLVKGKNLALEVLKTRFEP